jgi:hypothetical protein
MDIVDKIFITILFIGVIAVAYVLILFGLGKVKCDTLCSSIHMKNIHSWESINTDICECVEMKNCTDEYCQFGNKTTFYKR